MDTYHHDFDVLFFQDDFEVWKKDMKISSDNPKHLLYSPKIHQKLHNQVFLNWIAQQMWQEKLSMVSLLL